MAALHAAPTVATAADMHIKLPHVRPHDREILLNLAGDASLGQRTAAMRAPIRERDVDPFVNHAWRLTVRMAPMSAPRASAGPFRNRCARALRERRRLSFPRSPRRIQLLLQPVVLTAESFHLATQSLNLLILLIRAGRSWRRLVGAHAPFMTDSRSEYKRKSWSPR
jgi:hypothetical protein